MGEVWRAVDTKLGRDVAIKTLPEEFVGDAERLGRFEREARLLASLHHPNIAAIHGIEEASGVRFLVMQLADGEDLAQRIARGPIPVEEAMQIATSIAEALEAAHEKGIVHRDLKPANVRVTPEGHVTLLDFGLGKSVVAESSSPELSNSPTIARAATQAGVILGTAAYMSPEQARGRAVDRRSDIWAFGVVLWEMLTGRRLFAGETVSDTLAAVLRTEIEFGAVPEEAPASVRWILRRCLERDPRQRLRDIGEARIALTSPGIVPAVAARPVREPRAWLTRIFALAIAAGIVVVVAIAAYRRGSVRPLRKLDLGLDMTAVDDAPPHIAPDGSAVLVARNGSLAIRDLQDVEARLIPRSDGALFSCWSPDSRHVAFIASGKLWRAPREGGKAPVAITAVPEDLRGAGGITWLSNGNIVMAGSDRSAVLEVPARGGLLRATLPLDPKRERDLHEISALPDGRGMMFIVHRLNGSANRIDALVDGKRHRVFSIDDGSELGQPVWSPTGHVIFTKLRKDLPEIWALPFSLRSMRATGEAFRIAVGESPSVSSDGTLVYVRGARVKDRQLLRIDRTGRIEAEVSRRATECRHPSVAPDGRRIAATVAGDGLSLNLALFDSETRTMKRLVADVNSNWRPAFSPDGRSIAFDIASRSSVAIVPAAGGVSRIVCDGSLPGWWPDGQSLVVARLGPSGSHGIWRHWIADGREERLLDGPANEFPAGVSADEKLLAYVSDETGTRELFVRELDGEQRTIQISTSGITGMPRWSPKGDELLFRNADAFHSAGRTAGPRTAFSPPQMLFSIRDVGISRFDTGFDITPDGKNLVVTRDLANDEAGAALTVVTNWMAEFTRP